MKKNESLQRKCPFIYFTRYTNRTADQMTRKAEVSPLNRHYQYSGRLPFIGSRQRNGDPVSWNLNIFHLNHLLSWVLNNNLNRSC